MLKSVYSRVFYFSTIILVFACALAGITILLTADHLHELEVYTSIRTSAHTLTGRLQETVGKAHALSLKDVQTVLESYTLSENVDCYLFDTAGECQVRSDYGTAQIGLSEALMQEASQTAYCRIGGSAGNFSESTAIYVERLMLRDTQFYIMMIFPVGHVGTFSARLLLVLVISVLAIGVIGAALFYLVTAQLLKPLVKITQAAEQYATGDFNARLEPTGEPELDRLSETMNRMADSISSNERSRRRFVSDVSHELKTPMTTIGGYIDGILDGAVPKEEERHYLQIVSSEVQRMSRMVNSMLNISKFEEGSLSPNFTRFDITQLLMRTLFLFERKVDEKHLIIKGLDACPRTMVTADKDLMQQVLYNLEENAIKFVNEGGELTLAVESDSKQACVRIRNSGEGLTEREISHVFERFYKTDASRGKDLTGVGLGLSIVHRIMVLHSGTVTVRSKPGEYTEFAVNLPLVPAAVKQKPKN